MEDLSAIEDSTIWRSIESDPDNSNDESAVTEFFDLPDYDPEIISLNKTDDNIKDIILENTLLDGMRDLQIESAKKSRRSQIPVFSSRVSLNLEPVIVQNKTVDILQHSECIKDTEQNQNVEIKESEKQAKEPLDLVDIQNKSTTIENNDMCMTKVNEIKNDKAIDLKEKTEICKNDVKQLVKTINVSKQRQSQIAANMKKAIKPMFREPAKKPTKAVSPILTTSSRVRSVNRSISSLSLNQSQSVKTTVLKRQSSNISNVTNRSFSSHNKSTSKIINTVPTITSSKEGITFKEEKINNFSIPVILNRKKRTEFIPFSFLKREKNSQPKQSDVKLTNNAPINLVIKKTLPNNKTIPNKIINKENKSINANSTRISTSKVSVPTGPTKVCANKKVQERKEFDANVKKRELEIKKMNNLIQQKKTELTKIKENQMKIQIVTTTKAIPSIKPTLAPARSKNLLTESKKSAWANKRL